MNYFETIWTHLISKEYKGAKGEREKDKKRDRQTRPIHEIYRAMDKNTSRAHKN